MTDLTETSELNLENILSHFKKNQVDAVIQAESNQILIQIKINKVELPLFIRITEDNELIQFLLFFPCHPKEGCEADTARLLHLLNREIDIPGFGMDELNSFIFYRCIVTCPDQKFYHKVIDKYFNVAMMVSESFFPLIFSISQGQVKFSEISNKVDEFMQTAKS